MNLSQGTILGRYEILGPLGAGGMGEVYRARDLQLRREVAVKILPEHVAGNPDSLNRFEREALTLAQLSHPNILAIHDFGRFDGVTLAVMELLEGETLRRKIEVSGLSARRSLEIGAAVAEGLAAAHTKGVIHRDLKPENIFITRDNQVKILDFGLARLDDPIAGSETPADALPTQTEPGIVRGTIGYMSPEQLRGQPVDARSDIFSLGCVLYEMLTGRRAFAKATVADTMTAILTEDPPDFIESGRMIPPDAERLTTHCLEKDPSRRYQSAQDLALHLRSLASSPEIGVPRLASRFGWRMAALSAAVVLGILALFWFGILRPGQGPPLTAGENRPSVAVMYFENLTGDPGLDWMRSALTNMLVTDLSQSPHLEVVGTDRLYQILTEIGRVDDRNISSETVRQVARRARVNTVVVGSFVRAGDTFRLSTRLQDADNGRILATESVEGAGEASLFGMVDEITRRIKESLEVAPSDAQMDRGIEAVTSSSVEAYRYYVEGNDMHMRSKEREAIPLLEKAVELDPDFAMALAKLSVAHWNIGHVKESYDYARRALDHVDRLTARERYYIEGRFYSLNPETWVRAIEAYERAIALYPNHGPARHNLANLYVEVERFEDAIRQYEELVRQGTDFAGTHTNLANAYAAVGQIDAGLEALRHYVEKYPHSAAGHRDLGAYLLRMGRLAEAKAELDRAAVLDPGDVAVKMAEMQLHVSQGDFPAARNVAEELLSSRELAWRVEGRVMQAILALFQGDSRQALRELEAAEDLAAGPGPIRTQVLTYLARTCLQLEQPERALRAAEAAFEAGADYPVQNEALLMMALARARLARPEAALEAFEELRARFATLPQRLLDRKENHVLGLLALLEGDAQQAVARLEQSSRTRAGIVTWKPDTFAYEYGYALWQNRDPQAALPWFERFLSEGGVLAFAPIEYVRAHYYLGRCYAAAGRREEAGRHFRRFLELWGSGDMDRPLVEDARREVG